MKSSMLPAGDLRHRAAGAVPIHDRKRRPRRPRQYARAVTDAWDVVVRKDNLRESELLSADPPDRGSLSEGQVLVAVDHFSLSANNVTYGALGDQLGYWRFYPAAEPWGRI